MPGAEGDSKKFTGAPDAQAVDMASDNRQSKPQAHSAPAGCNAAAWVRFLLVATVIFAGDLALKSWSFNHVAGQRVHLTHETAAQVDVIPPHRGIVVIAGILDLKLTLNRGAVFGLGQGGRWFFILVTVVAMAVIVLLFCRSHSSQWLFHAALGLILAGALGNLYDRLLFGAVRDMLYLFPGVNLPFGWRWPGGSRELYPWIFNIADAALCVGVTLIMLTLLRQPRR
jgi:signal peptidase II